MKKFILSFLATVGFLVILSVAVFFYFIQSLVKSPTLDHESVSQNTVLKLTVGHTPFVDVTASSDLMSLISSGRSTSLFETVVTLKHAAKDPRIKGVLLSIEGSHLTLAQAQELHEALALIKAEKKKIYAFAYSFGEGSSGTTPYYLATIADDIFMQPQGSVELIGYAVDSYFLRDLFDKYKVKPQMDRREQYKGFIEPYTQTDFSPETRENLSGLLGNMLDQAQAAIAARMKTTDSQIKELMDAAPYLDQGAVDKKLVTKLLHKEEVKTLFEQDMAEKPTFVTLKTYRKQIQEKKAAHKFALISVSGGINSPGDSGSYAQDQTTPTQVAKSLKEAAEDPSISAIILRIDSPGGTVTGAQTIWYEVNRIANTLKKPLVVSMGSLAASAGYLIAAPATKIVANPATITGSIGVATGKLSIGQAAAEFGIQLRQIQTSQHAGMWSMVNEFTPEEWTKIQTSLDYYYSVFLNKVAEGRNLPLDAVRTVAKGQVWTGMQAKERGLVDELGGFLKAISVAKQLTNIEEETLVEIVMMEEHNFTEYLFTNLFESIGFVNQFTQDIKMMLTKNTSIQERLEFIPH